MATKFWQESFLKARRQQLLNAIGKFQFRISSVWYDAEVNDKEIDDAQGAVVVYVNMPHVGETADTITGVRLFDSNGILAGQQDVNVKRAVNQTALFRFVFPLVESST